MVDYLVLRAVARKVVPMVSEMVTSSDAVLARG